MIILKLLKIFLTKKIINFNKRLFKDVKISGDGIILCEFSGNLSNQVAFSFLIEKLKKLHKSKCIAYQDIIKFSFFNKLKIFAPDIGSILLPLLNFNLLLSTPQIPYSGSKIAFTSILLSLPIKSKI